MNARREPRWTTVLLDRDGVINRMLPAYVKRVEELELLSGAIEAMADLSSSGRQVLVVTNQSAIGQGLVTEETVDEIHRYLERLVSERGGRIGAFLVCPHTREAGCDCRKPAPGLILRARDEYGVDLARTVVVGDQLSDIEAARTAGCDAILVDPGATSQPAADLAVGVVPDLIAAVKMIRAA